MTSASAALCCRCTDSLEKAGLVTAYLELSDDGKALKYYEAAPFSLHLTPDVVAVAATTLSDAGDGGATSTGNS